MMESKHGGRIEGCWANTVDPKKFSKCRHCGTRQVAVPKEGHPNSHFWRLLQRPGEECLVCCPNGCMEEEGDYTFYMSRNVTGMVTPEGKIFEKGDFVMERIGPYKTPGFEHPKEAKGRDEDELLEAGWMYLDHGFFKWKKPLSRVQKLMMHCFCFGRGIDEKQFAEEIEAPSGYVCLKNLYDE